MKKLAILILISCSSIAFGQRSEQPRTLQPKTVVQNSSCGLKFNLINELLQNRPKDALFIIVSHLGKNEDQLFGKRRLYNIKTYMTWDNHKYRKPGELVLITEGERSKDNGYMDFYIKGELELRITFDKNADLGLGDCAPEKPCETEYDRLFYPCKIKVKITPNPKNH